MASIDIVYLININMVQNIEISNNVILQDGIDTDMWINAGSINHRKGGITDESEKIRQSPEYREWRIKVIQRDKRICQLCKQKCKKVNIHHILPFLNHKELRLDLNNGVCLCAKCHQTKVNRHEKDYEKLFLSIIRGDL